MAEQVLHSDGELLRTLESPGLKIALFYPSPGRSFDLLSTRLYPNASRAEQAAHESAELLKVRNRVLETYCPRGSALQQTTRFYSLPCHRGSMLRHALLHPAARPPTACMCVTALAPQALPEKFQPPPIDGEPIGPARRLVPAQPRSAASEFVVEDIATRSAMGRLFVSNALQSRGLARRLLGLQTHL